ncbi:tripartite tricarboxylate transporter substrate binding protein [Rhodoplanes roseus]|nr:tripartite tricarboxylate transporter substrate binding protein [Rhodoplanes roseus]
MQIDPRRPGATLSHASVSSLFETSSAETRLDRRTLLRHGLAGAAAALVAGAARAEAPAVLPNRPLRLVVPFAPGGSVDVLARAVGKAVTETSGRQVLVENLPGASTNLAADHVSRAAPDGSTLLVASDSLAINKSLFRNLGFDPVTSFQPVTLAITAPQILVTHPGLGVKTVDEFVARVKENPGKVTVGIPGSGVIGHLASELVNRRLGGLQVNHVPYNGGAPATRDLLGGHVDAVYITLPAVTTLVRGNSLVGLAVTSDVRSKALPAVPTFAETVLPDFDLLSWQGFLAPAGTPIEVAEALHVAIHKALESEGVTRSLVDLGYDIVGEGPRPFARRLETDVSRFAEVVRDAGIRIQ